MQKKIQRNDCGADRITITKQLGGGDVKRQPKNNNRNGMTHGRHLIKEINSFCVLQTDTSYRYISCELVRRRDFRA